MTFEEYNKELKRNNIKFISEQQEKEQVAKNEQTNIHFEIIVIIIIFIFILRHFDNSIIYKSCVKKCLKEGIICRDGWKITRYDVGGPLKIVKAYRFTETKDGNAKDYLYYRNDKYSPQEIYNIVNGKEITSFQITTYKVRVKTEIERKYIRYTSLTGALNNGMPNKIEYKVIWLRQKIYDIERCIAKGPEQSEQTWHGPYGWRYNSTSEDIRNFNNLERELRNYKTELYNLEQQKLDDEKNAWYWYE